MRDVKWERCHIGYEFKNADGGLLEKPIPNESTCHEFNIVT